jgi:hypothetical protein
MLPQFLVEGNRSPLNLGGLDRDHCAPPSDRRVFLSSLKPCQISDFSTRI